MDRIDVLGDCLAMLKQGAEMEAVVSGNAKHHFRVMQANCALAFLQSHGDALAELIEAAAAVDRIRLRPGNERMEALTRLRAALARIEAPTTRAQRD